MEYYNKVIESIGVRFNKGNNYKIERPVTITDYTEVENTLMKKVPKEEWSETHHRMIFFGRYHCKARNPNCPECPLLEICREGQKRMKKQDKLTNTK